VRSLSSEKIQEEIKNKLKQFEILSVDEDRSGGSQEFETFCYGLFKLLNEHGFQVSPTLKYYIVYKYLEMPYNEEENDEAFFDGRRYNNYYPVVEIKDEHGHLYYFECTYRYDRTVDTPLTWGDDDYQAEDGNWYKQDERFAIEQIIEIRKKLDGMSRGDVFQYLEEHYWQRLHGKPKGIQQIPFEGPSLEEWYKLVGAERDED